MAELKTKRSKLEDVDQKVLKQLIKKSVIHMKKTNQA